MDILASGGWAAAAITGGFGLVKTLAARRRGENGSKARVDLRHEFELLRAALNRIEVSVQPLPSMQRAVDTAVDDVRVLQGHIRRIDADIVDARRELSELEDRVQRIERRG